LHFRNSVIEILSAVSLFFSILCKPSYNALVISLYLIWLHSILIYCLMFFVLLFFSTVSVTAYYRPVN